VLVVYWVEELEVWVGATGVEELVKRNVDEESEVAVALTEDVEGTDDVEEAEDETEEEEVVFFDGMVNSSTLDGRTSVRQ